MDEMEGNRGSREAVQNKAGRNAKSRNVLDSVEGKGREKGLEDRTKRERGSVHAPVANVMIGSRKRKRQTLGPGLQVCRSRIKPRCSINLSRAKRKIRSAKIAIDLLLLLLSLEWRRTETIVRHLTQGSDSGNRSKITKIIPLKIES